MYLLVFILYTGLNFYRYPFYILLFTQIDLYLLLFILYTDLNLYRYPFYILLFTQIDLYLLVFILYTDLNVIILFSPHAARKGYKPGGYSLAAGVKGARNISEVS